ncbi:MAG: hypothetical protein Kow0074_19690 [Candidatus Zixiibacteriota bacterium]
MDDESHERPAPGVCWTYRPDEVPEHVLALLDGDISASPYLTPRWSRFWERAWTNTRADFWVLGSQDAGVVGVWTVKRRRWKWDWVFCQPYGTAGVFHSTQWASGDDELLTDVLLSTAGDQCLQVSLSGDVPDIAPAGWKSRDLVVTSWIYDARDRPPESLLRDVSDNHRRNIDKGLAADPDVRRVYGPAEVERMQSGMRSIRGKDSRIVLHPTLGPLFAEVFAGTREFRWYAAWHSGHCAATCLWLMRGNHAVYLDGAVDTRSRDLGINHYLFSHALADLFSTGIRLFDFGAGPGGQTSAGLARFKEGWGARPVERRERILRTPLYDMLRRIV